MTVIHKSAVLVLCFFQGVLPVTVKADSIEVIDLQRPAQELITVIKPLLKPGDGLSYTGNQLIVRTDARTLSQIRSIIQQIDQPLRNLRVTVRVNRTGEQRDRNTGVSADLVIGKKQSAGRIEVQHQSQQRRQDNEDRFSIQVIDGGRARIYLGQLLAHQHGAIRPNVYISGTAYQDVRSGFDVVPKLIGEQVRVEIHPQVRQISGSVRSTLDITEAHTILMVRPGSWMKFGEIDQSQWRDQQGIAYQGSGDRSSTEVLEMRIDILE